MVKKFLVLIMFVVVLFLDNVYAKEIGVEERVKSAMARVQVPFIENKGQVDGDVAYYASTFGGFIFITKKGELIYSMLKYGEKKDINFDEQIWRTKFNTLDIVDKVVLKERIIGGRVREVKGENQSYTKVSYFIGKDKGRWKSGLSTYEFVNLGEIYKGIELKLRIYGNNVEKIFYVKPGANPEEITFLVEGAKQLKVDMDTGELIAETSLGDIRFTKPIAYYLDEPDKKVEVLYNIRNNTYSFLLKNYDKTKTLIIDPLLASTFFGGNSWDSITSLIIDSQGNVYVAGITASPDFPVNAYDTTYNGGNFDVFIAKLNNDLTQLLASTFLGGNNFDLGGYIDIDAEGNIYVAGETWSQNFPTTRNAYSENFKGGYRDGFISKLNSDLTQLLASTYLGGSGDDAITSSLIIDSQGNIYVAGTTASSDFPVTRNAYSENFKGGHIDGFISKLNSDLTQLLASTYLGGSGDDGVNVLMIDSQNKVYVAGVTDSSDFPVNAYDKTYNGGQFDVFIAKLNAELTNLESSTFLGGNNVDEPTQIIVNYNNVYVAGTTASSDFPVNAYDKTYNGGQFDVFIAKLNNDLTQLLASTYLGGSGGDYIVSLACDIEGNIYVAGETRSNDFPTTLGAYSKIFNGGPSDGFISKLNSDLTQLLASTYLGGSGGDGITTLVIDKQGYLYVAGTTDSSNFPVTNSYDKTKKGDKDGFICKLDSNLTCTPPFPDVSYDHWAVDYIRAMKDAGITTGYPDGTFRPENPVKRSEMAAFIIRAIEGEPTSYNPNPYFADVPPTHWAFKYVQRVRERGIAQGYPGTNLYGPEDNVTREQMAKMLIMGLVSQGKISEPPSDYCSTGAPFPDVEIDRWSCRFIKRLKELNITTGYPDGTYKPENPVKRSEMAAFIYRAFLSPNNNTGSNLTPISNLDQGAQVASSLGSIRFTSYYISNLFYNFQKIDLGSTVSLTSAKNLEKLFSSDNVVGSSIKILNKLANSDALHVLSTSIKDSFSIKTVSLTDSQTTFNCPDGGTYSVNYSGGENTYDIIVNYNECKMNDVQFNGSLRMTGTESDFVMQIGTSSSPFSLLETENNYSTPISKQELQLIYNINNFKVDLNTNNISGSFTVDGSVKVYDYEDQSTGILTFTKLNEIFAFQVRNNFQANITANGKVELSLINSSNVQKGVSYTYNNFKADLIVDPNYEQYSLDGVVVIDYTPDFCYEGTFNFRTLTPIKYDNNLDRTVAGKIIVNDLTSIIYNSDGSITITTGNASKTFSDEDELENICYAF